MSTLRAVERSTDGILIERGYIVASLAGAITDGTHGLTLVPGLLKRVCNEGCWRRRYVEVIKQHVEFDSFISFVEGHPPEGLGVDLGILRKICRDDQEALSIIERETKRPHGGDRKLVIKIDNVQLDNPTGNTAERALRKLRTDAPELHRQVIDGSISPHAAMIEAGFRRKTLTVPLDPERAAVTLARHFTPDELKTLVSELAAMIDGRP